MGTRSSLGSGTASKLTIRNNSPDFFNSVLVHLAYLLADSGNFSLFYLAALSKATEEEHNFSQSSIPTTKILSRFPALTPASTG